MIAGQITAALILQVDFGEVEAAGYRQRQRLGQIERVRSVPAKVGVADCHPNRHVIARFINHHTGADIDAGEIGQTANIGCSRKLGLRAIERGTADKMILEPKQLTGVGYLAGRAVAVGVRGVDVQLTVRCVVAEERRNGRATACGAELAWALTQKIAAIIAWRVVRRITVDDMLLKIIVIGLGLQRKNVT